MWTRAALKTRAKTTLKTSYWKAFLISIVIAIAGGSGSGGGGGGRAGGSNFNNGFGSIDTGALALIIGIILFVVSAVVIFALAFRIFLGYPLEVGGRRYFVRAAHGEPDMNHLGSMFKKGIYGNVVMSMFWRGLINFLWYLLFIIPGIVKSYAYSMVPYILTDNPNIGYKRALELSNQMTKGQKFDMWVLDLSFIGWYLLGALALGIGVLFVMPYSNQTQAELYIVLRQNALETGLCTHEELFSNP